MKYVAAFLVLLSVQAFAETKAEAPKAGLSFPEREKLAATYMANVQMDSGLFRYEFDFLTGNWSSDNSLVRQAGAGYGLSEYLLSRGDDATKKVVEKALKAYLSQSVAYKSGKVLTLKNDLSTADTGATALALIAAIQYTKATGDNQFRAAILAWKTGLLALYTPKKGFASSPKDPKPSPYYDGEAWLGLSIYAASFPKDDGAKTVLKDADVVMMKTYSRKPDIGFFHWGLMAAAKRYAATKDPVFAEFGAQQATKFLTDLRPKLKKKVNSCYSVEGLAAILPVLEASGKYASLAKQVNGRVRGEMTKNVSFQIVPGQKDIKLPGDRSLVAPEIARYVGAFLNGADRPQIRTDFTQHCLSAMLKSEKYMKQ